MYSLFLNKHRMFYNFFRKSGTYRFTLPVRRGSAVFLMFWSNLVALNFYFDKRIPMEWKGKGLYEKYNLEYYVS